MDHAFDVIISHEFFWKFARDCRFDFAFVLTKLRWNVGHAGTRVDLLFSARQARKTNLLFLSVLLNFFDMRLRARLGEQRHGELFWRHRYERDDRTISHLREALVSLVE